MHNFLIKNNASIWLCFIVLILSAVMSHPNVASLIALSIEAVVVFVLRYVAQLEGRDKG